MQKEVLSILVDNHSGVLTRVASLFGRRGFNIDSLTVSTTDDPKTSRITIVVHDDAKVLEQIIKQTARLEETQQIFSLDASHSLLRELLLVKIEADEKNRTEVREIAEIYKAKIIDLSRESMVMELTGEPDKIDGFLDVLSPYKILEMCRTGVTALERGGIQKHPRVK
ncbi:acetolactate synthase small subunit [Ruthenibacterium sp. CLA-JM-H11]|uniref:Acetolactate synthase small subunit n=1 Tax=Ruthenibacterium intestinale TaxID=3133163 RepID=A0ABV1GIM5_9FIRM